jgi:uncharacterized membrane protein
LALERPEEARQLDLRFAVDPIATLLHVLPGGVFLVLAPFQFSSRIRNQHLRFHRWSGRVLVLVGLTTGVTGLYFGLLEPYGGPGEAVVVALVGGLFLTALGKALQAIRRGEVMRHREWMIRAFTLALAIATVRVVGMVVGIVLAPAGLRFRTLLTLSMWLGWAINLGAAELWIARTRAHAQIVRLERQ